MFNKIIKKITKKNSRCDFKYSHDKLVERILNPMRVIISSQDEKNSIKSMMAYSNFYESFSRLNDRYRELMAIELIVCNSFNSGNGVTYKMQMDFVNKSDAFHQQIYSTLSFFIKLLMHVTTNKLKSSMPTRSVEKFLNYFENEIKSLTEEIKYLNRSRKIRVLYIDHPQMEVGDFKWDTFSFGEVAYLVYYRPDDDGEMFNMRPFLDFGKSEILDRITPDPFLYPTKGKDFFVSPNHSRGFIALYEFMFGVCNHFKISSK